MNFLGQNTTKEKNKFLYPFIIVTYLLKNHAKIVSELLHNTRFQKVRHARYRARVVFFVIETLGFNCDIHDYTRLYSQSDVLFFSNRIKPHI